MIHNKTLFCFRFCRQVLYVKLRNVRGEHNFKKILTSLNHTKSYSTKIRSRPTVLGIETSCDDTGCAVVDSDGKILGEALNSQQQLHINHGGIIPPIARDLHQQHIESVVHKALKAANFQLSDVDAIATTVKPGLPLSLVVGMNYGKHLSRTSGKPFIPIHHMEAHALTIRMVQKVDFPFLVFLISGGHCLLALVQAVDKFLLLGQSIDDAPGEAFDKAARRLKLRNLPDFRTLSGGQAIELAASRSKDPLAFDFPMILAHYRDCNFSVSGLKNTLRKHIVRQERLHDIEADRLIPDVFDLCAGYQLAITRHLCQRLQRAIEFIELRNLLPQDNRTLVVSGGVACNNFIKRALGLVCQEMGYTIAVPPPHLCTDNGIMIAWNGMERWQAQVGITHDLDSVDIDAKCPLGENWIQKVTDAHIKCKWLKLTSLLETNREQQAAAASS